ncbi:MAG: type II toxin-antitoxin system VapC family toxin [Defluviicoccus sp.]|nr:type II toxin-antitoxin system VapC family toxin [Defluviicoccus sp.]MDE0386988.1 type II toxin-antitoxin system VapC family toxin [Defluviicoccus sp.]
MRFTVDAGIVAKWYVAEAHSEDARRLLAHRLERFAPDFLLVEFANTVWKKARRGKIADPRPYLGEIPELREAIDLLPTADLVERAARLALEFDHPVHDCLYFACAEATGSTLITADRAFADKAAGSTPEVRYIGAPGVADEIDAAAG